MLWLDFNGSLPVCMYVHMYIPLKNYYFFFFVYRVTITKIIWLWKSSKCCCLYTTIYFLFSPCYSFQKHLNTYKTFEIYLCVCVCLRNIEIEWNLKAQTWDCVVIFLYSFLSYYTYICVGVLCKSTYAESRERERERERKGNES